MVLVRAAVIILALLAGAVDASAQTADEILDDVDMFRHALDGTVHANVRIEAASSVVLRLLAARDGLTFVDLDGLERTVRADDVSLPFEQRLLAVVLTDAPLAEALDALEIAMGEQLLSVEVFEPDGAPPLLVRRLGTATVSIAVEPGIARLRELRIRHDDGVYLVQIPTYSDLASGWFPERVEIALDDQPLLALEVTDVAPDPGALAPLPARTGAPAVRFPRLPL